MGTVTCPRYCDLFARYPRPHGFKSPKQTKNGTPQTRVPFFVGLREGFENLTQAARTVCSRWSCGVYARSVRPVEPVVRDSRGRVIHSIGTAQTFLKGSEIDELVELYQQGKTLAELVERFGIYHRTAAAHLARRGIPMRQQGLKKRQIPKVIQLYQEGRTLTEVGLRFGVSQGVIRRVLEAHGIPRRRRGPRSAIAS